MSNVRQWAVGIFLVAGAAAAALSCRVDTLGTASSHSKKIVRSAVGTPVPEDEIRTRMAWMTQLVARALSDATVRKYVFQELHASQQREHKLHFGPFLTTSGNPLAARVGALADLTPAALQTELDGLPDLEFYMPVKAHWSSWAGGSNLIVATSLWDHDIPIAYDLQGSSVPLTSADVPPATPTLGIVPTESDFSVVPTAVVPCIQYCGPGGGGAPPPVYPGIYMTYSSLADLHEGFLRGSPEIEVCLIGRMRRTGTQAVTQAGLCANEGNSFTPPGVPGSPGNRVFDQNDNVWSSASPGVMVASKAELDSIAVLFPGVRRDSVPFSLQVWEDDTDRGIIYDPDNEYNSIAGAHALMGGAVLIGSAQEPGGSWLGIAFGAPLFLWGADHFISAIINVILGSDDDLVGMIVDAPALLQAAGIPSSSNHAVLYGGNKVGEVTLTYYHP